MNSRLLQADVALDASRLQTQLSEVGATFGNSGGSTKWGLAASFLPKAVLGHASESHQNSSGVLMYRLGKPAPGVLE